jgi:hypothetical protein
VLIDLKLDRNDAIHMRDAPARDHLRQRLDELDEGMPKS